MHTLLITRLASAALLTWAVSALAGTTSADTETLAKQGEYLARAADCMACHVLKGSEKPYAGGYAIDSPLGRIYSTNITPSKTHGIGNWTETQFARAVREGVAADGRNLYPAMPYPDYRNISDTDIKALYAYFMTQVAPVDQVPLHVTDLKFPFNIRASMIGWNFLFAGSPSSPPGPAPNAQLERGRYLVDVLGHCGSCHTPRNMMMASDKDHYLAGGPVGGWHAPNITSDLVSGIGGWTAEELAGYLKTGHAVGKAQAAGGMAEAVEHSLRHLSDADLMAMGTYLKSVPAKSTPGQVKPAYSYGDNRVQHYEFDSEASRQSLRDADLTSPIGNDGDTSRTYTFVEKEPSGARVYANACSTCHQPNGRGFEDQYYPSLSNNSAVGSAIPDNLIMTILKGVDRQGADGHILMPGYEDDLSDAQVAAVANYVRHRFGDPGATAVTPEQVGVLKTGGPIPLLAQLGSWAKPALAAVILLAASVLFMRRYRSKSRRRS